MPVIPALQPLFAAICAAADTSDKRPVAEARALAHSAMEQFILGFYAPAEPLPSETDHRVSVAGGDITVRVYSSGVRTEERAPPCHLYLHGGGFWLGMLDHFDALCRSLARDAGCVVAAVDYRLAPEHKFPTAAEDSYTALLWLVEHAAELGIDPARISVGGVSAGGNLAAVVALMARDRSGPMPVMQVLEVPITDLSDWEPLRVPEEGIELPSGKDRYCEYYLKDPSEALLPYVSPLLAPDLAGLPPALVMCAAYDPLAAEGKAYADKLARVGVPVEHHCWEGQFHGAQPMAALIPDEAAAYQAVMVAALRRAYGTDMG
jgi:acetyl esterase